MPEEFQQKIFQFALNSNLVALRDIRSYGINAILFNPKRSNKFIVLKYQGSEKHEVELKQMDSGYVTNIEITPQNFVLAYFHNYNLSDAKNTSIDLKIKLKSLTTYNYFNILKNFFFPMAHAGENVCPAESSVEQLSELTNSISAGTIANDLAECLWQATKDSTVGVVTGVWDCAVALYGEVCQFIQNPNLKLEQYINAVSKAVPQLVDFMSGLSLLTTNPALAISKLSNSTIGKFFIETYEKISMLPPSMIFTILCPIVVSIGLDAIIIALTSGAATPKLALTLKNIEASFSKIKKLLSLVKEAGLSKLGISEEKLGKFFNSIFTEKISAAKLAEFESISEYGAGYTRLALRAATCAL